MSLWGPVEPDRGAKRGRNNAEGDVSHDEEGSRLNVLEFEEKLIMYVSVEEENEELIEEAIDDVTGESLDPSKVAASRAEEIEFMETRGIWEVVDLSTCWDEIGQRSYDSEVGGHQEKEPLGGQRLQAQGRAGTSRHFSHQCLLGRQRSYCSRRQLRRRAWSERERSYSWMRLKHILMGSARSTPL